MIDRDELAAWLRLLETPGIGRTSARKLLTAFGSPEAVLMASAAAMREVAGFNVAQALAAPPSGFDAMVDKTLGWLSAAPDSRAAITLGDPRYPGALLETADPPLLLYTSGTLALLDRASLAIVGSRNPTPQGIENSRAFAHHLSDAGLVIVSGLALGVDAAAHDGALSGTAGTIAVVGTGLDQSYPRRNAKLAQRIFEQGLVLSEYSIGTPPLADHFPVRNRIIAGLSRGTLVVEATLQSGSLITARLAIEAGRDVYAIPGSIHSPQSRGCHALIKQGAKLVDTAQDILEDLRLVSPRSGNREAPSNTLTPANTVLDALGYAPMSLDALVARTGWSAGELNTRLLELELEGHVARLAGQQFQRIGRS